MHLFYKYKIASCKQILIKYLVHSDLYIVCVNVGWCSLGTLCVCWVYSRVYCLCTCWVYSRVYCDYVGCTLEYIVYMLQKRSIPMLFNEAKRTCTNPEVIANILQRQFSSVFSDPSATNINDALFQSPSLQKPFIDDMLAFSVADRVLHAFWLKGGHFEVKDGHPDFLQIT